MTPREYQREALDSIRREYDAGRNRLLAVLATGMGKTTGLAANLPAVFPELAANRQNEGGVLFLVHRIEIIRQAKEKFEALFPNAWVGLEQGENHATGYEDFVFASVDSLGRLMSERIFKYGQRKFGLIISDEAHHLDATGVWDNVLTYFGVGSDRRTHFRLSDGRVPLHVMLTATPSPQMEPFVDRCDTEHGYAAYYDILYGIRNGWLVDIRAHKAVPDLPGGVSLDEVEQDEQVDYLMRVYEDHAIGQTLVFARSVEQSRLLAESMTGAGLCAAASIDAETEDDERKRILAAFAAGEIQTLSNRFVLTEGYDAPGIQTILDNAPTTSRTRYPQKVGRGLRPARDAEIDRYGTAEERREAIKRSSKPALNYITTFDPAEENTLTLVSVLWDGRDVEPEDGDLLVADVIDVVTLIEEEHPERDLRDLKSVGEIDILLSRLDVWSLTVENPKLETTSPLRWVLTATPEGERTASIYLPENPRSGQFAGDDTPVVWHFHETGRDTGQFRFFEVGVGGWSHKLGRVAPAYVTPGQTTGRLTQAIRAMDEYVGQADPALFNEMKRGGSLRAIKKTRDYMRRNQIRAAADVTEETAGLLIDDHRIRRKMASLLPEIRSHLT